MRRKHYLFIMLANLILVASCTPEAIEKQDEETIIFSSDADDGQGGEEGEPPSRD